MITSLFWKLARPDVLTLSQDLDLSLTLASWLTASHNWLIVLALEFCGYKSVCPVGGGITMLEGNHI